MKIARITFFVAALAFVAGFWAACSIGFDETPRGTEVSWTVEMNPTGIYRPITRLSFPAFIRQLRAALANLKEMMEAGSL